MADGSGNRTPARDRDVEAQQPEEPTLTDQSTRLPPKQFALVCFSMILSITMTNLEQNGVSTTLPSIAKDLGNGQDISWVGTSYLIGNAAGQAVWGRLSDIFGRKSMLVASLCFFCLGNLLCGFSTSLGMLLAFRVFAGIGGGGTMILCLVIMSDLVSLKNRGKIQGIVGIGVALGTSIGPILGGAFAGSNHWRWIFWVMCPPSFLTMIQVLVFLPLKPVTGDWKEKFRNIDFSGIALLIGSTVLLLVPISGGGASFAWDSAVVITLFVVGALFVVAFCLNEKYYARLPVIPLRLFRNRTLSVLALITFATGLYNFAIMYFIPVYLQVVRGYTPLMSSGILQGSLLPQVLMVVFSGYVVSWTGRYMPILWTGYALCVVSSGVATRFDRESSIGFIVGILCIGGLGVGMTLQTSLVAMQANAPHPDRAVVTGARNMARFIGSAVGISVCTSLVNNSVTMRDGSTGFEVPPGLTAKQKDQLVGQYMKGIKQVWYFNLAVTAFIVFMMLGAREQKLRGDEVLKSEEQTQAGEEGEDEKDSVVAEGDATPVGLDANGKARDAA